LGWQRESGGKSAALQNAGRANIGAGGWILD